jgi:predicted ribonuclease YlaK
VRLVIPLRVIEELDSKKYGSSDRLGKRARALLPQLEQVAGMGGTPSPLIDGVTLEVLIEPGPRLKPVDADEEILDACRELWQLSGQAGGVTLVTSDTALRMRADALGGIRTVAPPDACRRDTNY